jgi:hypothetical protein
MLARKLNARIFFVTLSLHVQGLLTYIFVTASWEQSKYACESTKKAENAMERFDRVVTERLMHDTSTSPIPAPKRPDGASLGARTSSPHDTVSAREKAALKAQAPESPSAREKAAPSATKACASKAAEATVNGLRKHVKHESQQDKYEEHEENEEEEKKDTAFSGVRAHALRDDCGAMPNIRTHEKHALKGSPAWQDRMPELLHPNNIPSEVSESTKLEC